MHSTHFSSFSGGDGAYSEPYRLYNLDVFEFELDVPMALYGSVPFLMAHKVDTTKGTSHTTGFFWLNAAETWIDVTKAPVQVGDPLYFQSSNVQRVSNDHDAAGTSTTTHWISESGKMDFFVLIGPSPKDVMRQYATLTGSQNLPQQFALGYHQCRWNYIDRSDVAQVHENFEQHQIPVDVIWLDIEHTNDKRYFTWHASKFNEPQVMQQELAKYGRKMVTIIDPHIKRDDEYFVKKAMTEKSLFVKSKDGSEYEGWCWPGEWSVICFDMTD